MTRPATIIAALLAVLATACGSTDPGPAGMPPVTAWVTTADQARLLDPETPAPTFRPSGRDAADGVPISIDDTQRHQRMAGFGASITDASAWLMRHRMSEAQRTALLRELFGREGAGVGFDLARLTIGASDFSQAHYTFDDRPSGEADLPLAHFSIDPHRADVLPLVKQALAVNPGLRVMASPWSAPAWMKSNGRLIQGRLRPDMHDAFARYLLRYVEAMAVEGVPIFALTVQNEPLFEPGDYPGMRIDAPARADLIGRHLGPMLAARAPGTQIIEWDHNWDRPDEPLAVLADPVARQYVGGVGWHCYVSDTLLPNQSVVRDAHPDKDVWLTECSGGGWKPHWGEALSSTARDLVIRSVRHWARGVLMWNLALDEQHGPHLGGCPNCRGLVTIDPRSGAVTRTPEYYAFAHASRFVRTGAWRIGSSEGRDGVDNVAFLNADDGTIVLVVGNSATRSRRIAVRHGGREFTHELAPQSVATYTWPR